MSEPPSPSFDPSVSPVEGERSRRPVLAAGLLGVVGVVEVAAVYLLLRRRLPNEITDHFGLTGQANGSLPPEMLLTVELANIALVSAGFVALLWWSGRSAPLASVRDPGLTLVILGTQALMVVVVVPLDSALLLASAAGVWSLPGQTLGLATLATGTVPVVALLAAVLLRRRDRLPEVARYEVGSTPAAAFLAIGGPIELACSACGQAFRLTGVPLLAPHMGRSVYVRCPKCGERGWDPIVGKVAG